MSMEFDAAKSMDIVAMGRATVDLYANETGPLEDAKTFSKYVGGSPANTAVAMGNMGLKVGYIGKVSDDPFGRYIVRYLARKGVDTSHIRTDRPGVRSGITIGEIRGPRDCHFYVYRTDVADLHISCEDLEESYIARFKGILISGTSLSHSPAREAVFLAMEMARRNNVRIIFDPDYREGTWDSDTETSLYYRLAAEKADMIIGTREEFDRIEALTLPGNTDDRQTARSLFACRAKLVAVKHGRKGSTIYLDDGRVLEGPTYPAKVVKTFGAGDAYAGAFLYGLVGGLSIEKSLQYAAAAAAITISGHSCSDSTPTRREVEDYVAAYENGTLNIREN